MPKTESVEICVNCNDIKKKRNLSVQKMLDITMANILMNYIP